MNKSEVIAFLNAHKRVHVATVEGNTPHVRRCRIHRADEKNGIILETFSHKPLCKQLRAIPKVELVFDDYQECGKQISKVTEVRVSGTVEFFEDKQIEDEILTERHTIRNWVGQGIVMVMYRLRNGVATVWTYDKEFEPKSYIQL